MRLQCLVRAGDSVQALCLGRQPRIRDGAFLLRDRAGWDAPGQRPVIAVQHILFDQLLKIPWVFRQPFPDDHTVRCGGIAQLDMRAEQRFHDCESNPHAQRLAAADDLMVVDEILEALPVKAVAHKNTERVQYDLPEALCVLRIGFAQVKAQDRLAVSPHHPHGEIKSDARRQHGTGQGRFRCFGKIAPQNRKGKRLLRAAAVTQHAGKLQQCVTLCRLAAVQLVIHRTVRTDNRRLKRSGRRRCPLRCL